MLLVFVSPVSFYIQNPIYMYPNLRWTGLSLDRVLLCNMLNFQLLSFPHTRTSCRVHKLRASCSRPCSWTSQGGPGSGLCSGVSVLPFCGMFLPLPLYNQAQQRDIGKNAGCDYMYLNTDLFHWFSYQNHRKPSCPPGGNEPIPSKAVTQQVSLFVTGDQAV